MIDFHIKQGMGCFLLKIDFEKASDSISWSHLDHTLSCMGFGDKWRSWNSSCVLKARVNIMIKYKLKSD